MEVIFVLPEQPDGFVALVFGGHGVRRLKEILYTPTVVELRSKQCLHSIQDIQTSFGLFSRQPVVEPIVDSTVP